MVRKRPRRTAERILEVALELFNRYGEPNVSTTLISSELGISPGNLYYHYPAKEELVNALFGRHEQALGELLSAAGDVRDVEGAWFFLHSLFELIWAHRFLYRDLNHLLSRNRLLETRCQAMLERETQALRAMLAAMEHAGALDLAAGAIHPEALAAAMVVVLTYWLSFEYVRDPRHALEPGHAQRALLRGAYHVLCLLAPCLAPAQRAHMQRLADAYRENPR
jgi:AcrR family transcriptional regulator